ncbi:unnamed protein product [Brachionus calyciflorus]|uniref:Uncharacterized protein n=1 Tax=Brachionus calyciflorus TaxID=104777 RepID=A0A814BAF6_9BILA|nr:unnamed protein product [Brachionus calyciflorus]
MHLAKIVTEWFTDKKIECLKWPANSPDLNCTRNPGKSAKKIFEVDQSHTSSQQAQNVSPSPSKNNTQPAYNENNIVQ